MTFLCSLARDPTLIESGDWLKSSKSSIFPLTDSLVLSGHCQKHKYIFLLKIWKIEQIHNYFPPASCYINPIHPKWHILKLSHVQINFKICGWDWFIYINRTLLVKLTEAVDLYNNNEMANERGDQKEITLFFSL